MKIEIFARIRIINPLFHKLIHWMSMHDKKNIAYNKYFRLKQRAACLPSVLSALDRPVEVDSPSASLWTSWHLPWALYSDIVIRSPAHESTLNLTIFTLKIIFKTYRIHSLNRIIIKKRFDNRYHTFGQTNYRPGLPWSSAPLFRLILIVLANECCGIWLLST